MAQAPHISDYAVRALARLPQQFKSKPNLADYITAMFWSLQEVENVAEDLLLLRWLKNAAGAQLDGIGEIVGEARLGREDDDYREAIRQRIAMNCSKGTPQDLIMTMAIVTEATAVYYYEQYPARVQLLSNGSVFPTLIHEILEAAAPAGVEIAELLLTYGQIPLFFRTEYGEQKGLGFSEPGYMVGGSLSEKV